MTPDCRRNSVCSMARCVRKGRAMGKLSGESNEIVSLGARALLVERVRLVRKTLEQARRAGVVFVCAPAGFGKTALLMQCVAAVQSNPEEGPARIMDVRGMEPGDLLALLDDLAQEVDPAHGALIALDNLPAVASAQVGKVVERLRALRDAKAKVLIACTPCCRPVVRAMGDSEKVNASSLLVRPNEYAKWVDALGISNALDAVRPRRSWSRSARQRATREAEAHSSARWSSCTGRSSRSFARSATRCCGSSA